jgi:hypothetical protein
MEKCLADSEIYDDSFTAGAHAEDQVTKPPPNLRLHELGSMA